MSTTILGWKPEPAPSLGYAEEDDFFLIEDEEKQNGLEDGSYCTLTRREIAKQLLADIDSFVKQENEDTFSQWFEDKINLPIFDEIEPVLPAEDLKPGIEELRDLEEVLNRANLTPPNSPETPAYIILNCVPEVQNGSGQPEPNLANDENYIELAGDYEMESVFPEDETPDYLTAPPTPVPDLEKEMAVVDELIRSTAQGIEATNWESDSSASRSSSSECDGSPGRVRFEEESDDPEWVPAMKKTLTRTGKPGRRAKPYGRECSQQDKWLRKKEQNKNAATRYRQKKKAEVSEIIEEEKKLEEEREKLKLRVADIQMEIKYIKGLMRDLFKAKGLLIN